MVAGNDGKDLSVDDLRPILSSVQLTTYEKLLQKAQVPFGMPQAFGVAKADQNPLLKSPLGFRWEEADGTKSFAKWMPIHRPPRLACRLGTSSSRWTTIQSIPRFNWKRASSNALKRKSWKMRVHRGNDTVELSAQ